MHRPFHQKDYKHKKNRRSINIWGRDYCFADKDALQYIAVILLEKVILVNSFYHQVYIKIKNTFEFLNTSVASTGIIDT